MIAIFDYGAGNLRSVENTLASIGAGYEIVRDSAGLERADKIILPGVGHFGQLIRSLDALECSEHLSRADRGRRAVPGHLSGHASAV